MNELQRRIIIQKMQAEFTKLAHLLAKLDKQLPESVEKVKAA